jgi:hypothetical protein
MLVGAIRMLVGATGILVGAIRMLVSATGILVGPSSVFSAFVGP